MTYDTILFDLDGVLIEPTDPTVFRQSIARTFREFGVDDPDESCIEAMIGTTAESIRGACSRYGIDPDDFWSKREQDLIDAQIKEMQNGNKNLYDDIHLLGDYNIKYGIVSNNQHQFVQHLLEFSELGDLVEVNYGCRPTLDGYRKKKPHPYYLNLALDDVPSRDALYVGDANTDILAAQRAGIDSAHLLRQESRSPFHPSSTYQMESLHGLVGLLDEAATSGY